MAENTEPKIEKHVTYDRVLIYIGEVLHLAFGRRRLIGLQSWPGSNPCCMTIELLFRDGATMRLEYDTPSKWEQILLMLATEITGVTNAD